MEMEALDESRDSFVMGNLWNVEVHIREASDVVAQSLILLVPYPLEIIFVS